MRNSNSTNTPRIPSVLSEAVFKRFSSFIYDEVGIKMPPAKKTMLEARLNKRLKQLGYWTFEEYADFVFSPEGKDNELINLIDVITTNKTDFFREQMHFEYLTKTVIPNMIHSHGSGFKVPFKIWSAGCSTGEEPYTMAITLSDFAEINHGFMAHIFATDVSTAVLAKAQKGIYSEDNVNTIPLSIKRKFFLKSRDKTAKLVRVVPKLRSMIRFSRLNFMDDFAMKERFDVIFCRNVIIYFDKQTQEKLLNKFCKHLVKGGYLFLGHSESINGMTLPLTPVATTVYRKA